MLWLEYSLQYEFITNASLGWEMMGDWFCRLAGVVLALMCFYDADRGVLLELQ